MASVFRTQEALWYNTGIWGTLGFAVPNFGLNPQTQNSGIADLVEVTGKNLQAILCDQDAYLTVPPTINTLTRIHQLIIRARSILAAEAVPSGTPMMEGMHVQPAAIDFLIFPTPYFQVRNKWLRKYAYLVMCALTEATQHTENARAFDFSMAFSGLIGQYLQRIYVRMAVELLQIPLATASDPAFTLTAAQLGAYNPAAWFTSTEMDDVSAGIGERPSDYDMTFLAAGIPANKLVGLCLQDGTPIPLGIADQQLAANPIPAPTSASAANDPSVTNTPGSDSPAAGTSQAAAGAASGTSAANPAGASFAPPPAP